MAAALVPSADGGDMDDDLMLLLLPLRVAKDAKGDRPNMFEEACRDKPLLFYLFIYFYAEER
jgi:hypothetical protein